jgi:hypothetical protein
MAVAVTPVTAPASSDADMNVVLYSAAPAPAPPGASSWIITIGMLSATAVHAALSSCSASSGATDLASGSRQKNTTAPAAEATTTRSLPKRSAKRPATIMMGISRAAPSPTIHPTSCVSRCRVFVTYSAMSMLYIWLTTPRATSAPSSSQVRPGSDRNAADRGAARAAGAGDGGSRRRPRPSAAVTRQSTPTIRYSGPKPNLVIRKIPTGGPMTQDAENTDRTAMVNEVTGRSRARA